MVALTPSPPFDETHRTVAAAKREILLVDLGDDAELGAIHERAIGSKRSQLRHLFVVDRRKELEHGDDLARAAS